MFASKMAHTNIRPKPLKIFIHTMDGAGHLNSSIGLGQALAERGHNVIFVVNEVHQGKFVSLGFREILLRRKSDVPLHSNPIALTAEQLRRNGLLSGVSSYEKMKVHNVGENNFLSTLCDKLADFDGQFEEAIGRESPDVLVHNQFLTPPAFLRVADRIPWIYQYPCNPLGLYRSEKLPPFYSGFPVDSDPSTWTQYRVYLDTEYVQRFNRYQQELNARCSYQPRNGELEVRARGADYFAKSPYLTIYDCPAELDYDDCAPRPTNCVPFEAFFRKASRKDVAVKDEEPYRLPEGFVRPGDKLIFVSMGSMGGIDIDLMTRIVPVLGKTKHKYIVSKGLRADEYELPTNCWGESYLPQTAILPLVDLVISHGGNNTITESFAFGKPMIVMPLFFDQYDNAQRVHEKGFGLRLEPYQFTEEQLIEAIDKLLEDDQLRERCRQAAERMERSDTEAKACAAIEDMVERFQQRLLTA